MRYAMRQVARRLCLGCYNFLAIAGNIQRHRLWLLRLIGVRMGSGIHMNEFLYVLNGFNIEVGDGSNLGAFLKILDYSSVKIGARVLMSNNITIISGTHNVADYSFVPGPVFIGDDCWIGAGVTIIGPCHIGAGTIVGAGAVVLGSLPAKSICVGVPAKKIRERP